MIRLEIRDKNRLFDINKEAAEISALSSEKINKIEYFKVEEIIASDQRRLISSLRKTLEKQRKTIEAQDKKQIKAIEDRRTQLIVSNDNFNIDRNSVSKIINFLERGVPNFIIWK